MTLVTTRGSWTCVAVQDTQFSLRGSDNFLWVAGDLNYGWQGANGGRYLMRFSNLSKTAVKHLYLTARGGSRAVLVEGPTAQQGGLDFSDCVIEGQNAQRPGDGRAHRHRRRQAFLHQHQAQLRHGASVGLHRPEADTALIMVLGGTALIANVWVNKANKPGTSTRSLRPSRSSTSAAAPPT